MRRLQLAVFLFGLVLTFAASDELTEGVAARELSTKLVKAGEEINNKSGKRDSSEQTAGYAANGKDAPFRPIESPYYQEALSFRPTTVRYVATTAAAAPQTYYQKAPPTNRVLYTQNGGDADAAAGAYRGPINPAYQQQLQQGLAVQELNKPSHRFSVLPAPSQQSYVGYADPDVNYVRERLPPQLNHQQRPQQLPFSQLPNRAPQQQVQYLIAIPLSHVRQLQEQQQLQQLAAQAYALPHRQLQQPAALHLGGGVDREQAPSYGPAVQYAASAPDAPPTAPAPHGYASPFLQLPAGVLLASNGPYQRPHSGPPVYYQRNVQPHYQQYIAPPSEHPGQQLQQRSHQQPQQFILLQHQLPQQQQEQAVVRIGGSNPGGKPAHQNSASPASSPPFVSPHSTLPGPIVHYNPVYVQAPPVEQQQQLPLGLLNFVRYAAPPHLVGGPPSLHPHSQPGPAMSFLRISLPKAVYAPPSAPNYAAVPPAATVPMAPGLGVKTAYTPTALPFAHYAPEARALAAKPQHLPYFHQPSAVQYGTHLHNPSSTAATPAQAPVRQQQQQPQSYPQQHNQQPQPQQPQRQLRQQPPAAVRMPAASSLGSTGHSVVKYP